MAQEPEMNKSKSIREYLAENPEASPRQVAEALVARGIPVTSAFVSAVRSTARSKEIRRKAQGQRGRGRRSTAGRAAASNSNASGRPGGAGRNLSLDQLIAAKRFANEMGGIARARAALEALEKVTS